MNDWMVRVLFRAGLVLAIFMSAADAVAQTKYALVIGIKGYPNFADNPLRFADRDAKAFAEFIMTPEGGGFPAANVHLMRNEDAKRVDIFRELVWLKTHVRVNVQVYIFFSGHGVEDENHQVFFMPYDGDSRIPEAAGIRSDEFLKAVRDRISPKQLIFFIDACHAGAAALPGGTTKAGEESTIALEWKKELEAAPEVNMAFLSASSRELSREDPGLQHGLFTWFLLEGLRGAADSTVIGNKDGAVTVEELYRYLSENVPKRSRALFSATQTPTVTTGFVPDLRLSRPGVVGDTRPSKREGTIQDALDAYRSAYELRNVDALLEVFPKYQGVDELRRKFSDVKGAAMALGKPIVTLNSEKSATVRYQEYSLTYTTRNGKLEQIKPRPAEFTLRKDGLIWVIDAVRFP